MFKKVKNKAREIKAAADNLIGTVADMTNIIDLNEKKSMIDSLEMKNRTERFFQKKLLCTRVRNRCARQSKNNSFIKISSLKKSY